MYGWRPCLIYILHAGYLESTDSFMNKGTLHQLKNVLNRSLPASKVKLNYRAVHDFFGIVLDAHITAAAMEH